MSVKKLNPLYRVLKTDGEGSHAIVIAREKPDGNLEFISLLVDVWKMGLKDCFGSHSMSQTAFKREFMGVRLMHDFNFNEALWMIKHGIRIANELKLPLPEEFEDFKYILGDMSNVDASGSLYKCFKCMKGDLSEEIVKKIKEITLKDVRKGICGTPFETPIYFVCDDCKSKLR